jgi:uncharacterized membrane protein
LSSTGNLPDTTLPSRSRWGLAVALALPALLLLMLNSGSLLVQFAANLLLGIVALLPFLRRHSVIAWLILLLIAAVCGVAVQKQDSNLLAYLPQVLISLLFLMIFGRTLRPGSEPLITRISTATRHGQSATPSRYTRGVTILWTVIFALLILQGLFFGFVDTGFPESKVSVATWALVLAVLVVEYFYHSRRYPNPLHRNLIVLAWFMYRV